MGTVNIPERRRKTLRRARVYTTGTETCCGGPDDKGSREGTQGDKSVCVALFRAYILTTGLVPRRVSCQRGYFHKNIGPGERDRAMARWSLEFARNRVSAQSSGKFPRVTTSRPFMSGNSVADPMHAVKHFASPRVGLACVSFCLCQARNIA